MSSATPAAKPPTRSSSKRDKDNPANPDLQLNAVGNYNMMKTLGEGNFAKVKLAKHKLTGAEVAVKIIDKTQLDEKKLAKLYREVRIMKSLNHPNIIKLYEVIETKNTVFLVMEHAAGGELYDYLVVHGKMKERDARSKFRQILSAVSYCHKKKIIHRDLKAENLLLDENLNIKIADFGFSNNFDPESKLDTFCGSPPYAAPELFQGRRYVGPEVDVWSLGVILYVLTTGCLPFDGKNLQEMRESVCRGKYRIPFYLSDGCERLLRKFLVRDPLRRAGLEIVIDDAWVNEGYGDSPVTTDLGGKVDEEENIIQLMISKYQCSKEDILKSLRENIFNDIAATYYLMYHENEVRTQIQGEVDRGEIVSSPFSALPPAIPSPAVSSRSQKTPEGSNSPALSKGMGKIDEDGATASGSIEGSKTPSSKHKSSSSSRRRRMTVTEGERADDSSGTPSPAPIKKDSSSSNVKPKKINTITENSDSRSGSKTEVFKSNGESSPQGSPSNPRIDRKRNNTIVGILRDKIRRPTDTFMSPTLDKGNVDVIRSGTLGSGTVDSPSGSTTNVKPGEENKPRSLRFTFNSNSTSTKNPDDIVQEIVKACNKLAVTHKLISKYIIECYWNNPASGKETTKLEIEVCKLPRLNNLHGLRFKRLGGGSSDYKELCETLLKTIQL